MDFYLYKFGRLSNHLYIQLNLNKILIIFYKYYIQKIKKIQLYLQKMIWTFREFDLPLLVHSTMHLSKTKGVLFKSKGKSC